jgi:hypothetical protein
MDCFAADARRHLERTSRLESVGGALSDTVYLETPEAASVGLRDTF